MSHHQPAGEGIRFANDNVEAQCPHQLGNDDRPPAQTFRHDIRAAAGAGRFWIAAVGVHAG